MDQKELDEKIKVAIDTERRHIWEKMRAHLLDHSWCDGRAIHVKDEKGFHLGTKAPDIEEKSLAQHLCMTPNDLRKILWIP